MKKRFVIPIVSVLCIGVILLVRWMGEKPAVTAASDSSRILTAAEKVHAAQARAKKARAILAQSKPRPATTVTVGATSKVAPPIYGTQWGREEEPEMKAFSDWTGRYAKTPSREKSRLLEEGVRLAKERVDVLAELIEHDPEAALAVAIPQSAREGLPEEVLAHSEHRIIGTGRLEVIASTAEPGRATPAVQRSAQFGRRSYQAYVYGGLKRFGTVDDLYMHGIAVNGSIALADSPVRELEPGERLKPDKTIAANHPTVKPQIYQPEADGKRLAEDAEGYLCLHCTAAARASYDAYHWAALGGEGTIAAAIGRAYRNTGNRSCLIIPVEFPDRLGSPWSSDSMRDTGISRITNYFSTTSYGLLNVNNATVIPLQTLSTNRTAYRNSDGSSASIISSIFLNLRTDAAERALAAGYDVANYDFVTIVINHNLWTDAGGWGNVGAKYSLIDGYYPGGGGGSEQDQGEDVYIHELGHNLGLQHAGTWNPASNQPDDSNGTRTQYGHPFDAMGNNPNVQYYTSLQYNAAYKNALDWLPNYYVTTIDTNTTDTVTLSLYAMDRTQSDGRKYAVRIPAGITLGTATNLDYWLEYRSLAGTFLVYSANSTHDSDALNLLDMAPETESFIDAGFQVGGGAYTNRTYTTSTQMRITVDPNLLGGGFPENQYITVTVRNLVTPSITTHPQNQTIHPGNSTNLTVTASGPSLSYQWRKDGVAISGATSSTLALTNASSATAGTYDVVVSNLNGSVTSNGAVVTVRDLTPPSITTHPQNQTMHPGSSTNLTVTASGPDLTYQWRKGGVNISGATSSTLALTNVTSDTAGTYDVVVTNLNGNVTSNGATVTVRDLTQPSIATHPQSQTIQSGNSANLTVTASGPDLSYQWRKDGVNVSGATSSTLSLTNASSSTAGTYTVVVTNLNGNVTSNGAVITVEEPSGGGGCGYITPPEQLLLIGCAWAVLLLCRFLQRMPIRPLQPREEAA